ncbi:MAG: NAD-dependent epimerase/dehydratase family protein [Flavobacteriales bacterium]
MSAQKTILITGAQGFLGRELIKLLSNARVIQLVRNRPDTAHLNGVYADLNTLFKSENQVDVIFHLAAHIPSPAVPMDEEALERVHVQLPKQLTHHYTTAKHVLASSISIYGAPMERTITWNTASNAPNPYGLSKLHAESVIRETANHAVIRFSSIIGAEMKRTTMIPKMLEDALHTKNITIWGNGDRLQNYIDVRDAARILMMCAEANENLSVLGIGRYSRSNLEVAEILAAMTKSSITFTPGADETGYRYDDREMHQHIGFIPKFDLEDSIRDIIATWTRS